MKPALFSLPLATTLALAACTGPHVNTAAQPTVPVASISPTACQLSRPIAAQLPVAPYDSFAAIRSDSPSGDMHHDGVDLYSNNSIVKAVRGGRMDFYAVPKGNTIHHRCISVIVNEMAGISDVYCGLETTTSINLLDEVKTDTVLGTATHLSDGRYGIHYGIHEFSASENVDRFLDPTLALKRANPQTCYAVY